MRLNVGRSLHEECKRNFESDKKDTRQEVVSEAMQNFRQE